MPSQTPYIGYIQPESKFCFAITVLVLADGEDLAPHRDKQSHRHFRNSTIFWGSWEDGLLWALEDDIWSNQDSRDQLVVLDARNTFHRVTPVAGIRDSSSRNKGIDHPPHSTTSKPRSEFSIYCRESRISFPADPEWSQSTGLRLQSSSRDERCHFFTQYMLGIQFHTVLEGVT